MKQKTEKRLDAVAKTRLIRAAIAKQMLVNPLQYLAEMEEARKLLASLGNRSANRVA